MAPPDPNRLLRWTKGVRLRQQSSATYGITDPERSERLANQIAWQTGTSEAAEHTQTATGLFGDTMRQEKGAPRAGGISPLIDTVFTGGPNAQVIYEDGLGQIDTTVEDYYSRTAAIYLDEEGFYDERYKTYKFNGMGTEATPSLTSSVGDAPAPITLAPTSSIFPARPRTVAAGYDPRREILTVVFRDGTYYNYYGVSPFQWGNFVRARSKGRYIKKYLDGKMRGNSNVSDTPMAAREAAYRLARTAQIREKGRNVGQAPKASRPGYAPKNTEHQRILKNVRARAAAAHNRGNPPPPGTSGLS